MLGRFHFIADFFVEAILPLNRPIAKKNCTRAESRHVRIQEMGKFGVDYSNAFDRFLPAASVISVLRVLGTGSHNFPFPIKPKAYSPERKSLFGAKCLHQSHSSIT